MTSLSIQSCLLNLTFLKLEFYVIFHMFRKIMGVIISLYFININKIHSLCYNFENKKKVFYVFFVYLCYVFIFKIIFNIFIKILFL